jgi:hypothetical protein
MTDELIPDNPHLKQIDTLFRQMAYSRVTPTENDIKCADLLADTLRLWAGIPIIPLEELETIPEAPQAPQSPSTPWASRADIAKRDAILRRN